jgi:nicotinamidase-related amidase
MKAAFLIIDMQNDQANKTTQKAWATVARNLCAARDAFGSRGISPIHVGYFPILRRSIPDADRIGSLRKINRVLKKHAIIPKTTKGDLLSDAFYGAFQFPLRQGELVTVKADYSACTCALTTYLRRHAIDTVLMGGVWEGKPEEGSACCVTASAIDFARAGFRSIIVRDATNFCVHENYYKNRVAQNRRFGVEVRGVSQIVRRLPPPPRRVFDFGSIVARLGRVLGL